MGMTMTQKILAAHVADGATVRAGELYVLLNTLAVTIE